MSFLYKRSATIDHTKCAATAQNGFPVCIVATFAQAHLRADAFDFYVYSDESLTTRIPAEREYYNSATGVWIGWIKVDLPASNGSDIIIWFGYGDDTIETDPNSDATYGATSVWDANFKGVYHFPNGTTLNCEDSTSNNNDGAKGGGNLPTATAGIIDGATSVASQYSRITFASVLAVTAASFWLYPNGINYRTVLFRVATSHRLGYDAGPWRIYDGSARIFTTAPSLQQWHHYAIIHDGTNYELYKDGVYVEEVASGVISIDSVGRNSGEYGALQGKIDELRFSDTARSADWISAEYKNQSDQTIGAGHFWSSISDEESSGPTIITCTVNDNVSVLYNDLFKLSRAECFSISDVYDISTNESLKILQALRYYYSILDIYEISEIFDVLSRFCINSIIDTSTTFEEYVVTNPIVYRIELAVVEGLNYNEIVTFLDKILIFDVADDLNILNDNVNTTALVQAAINDVYNIILSDDIRTSIRQNSIISDNVFDEVLDIVSINSPLNIRNVADDYSLILDNVLAVGGIAIINTDIYDSLVDAINVIDKYLAFISVDIYSNLLHDIVFKHKPPPVYTDLILEDSILNPITLANNHSDILRIITNPNIFLTTYNEAKAA
jgi:hypothetical protein